MTDDTFNAGMTQLFAAHGRKKDQEVMDTYWNALKNMDDEGFKHAIERSRSEDETFPKIPKLRTYAREIDNRKSREDGRFSFYHEECDTSFSVHINDLVATRWFICEHCKIYNSKTLQWNGEVLRQKMEAAKAQNVNLAYLD